MAQDDPTGPLISQKQAAVLGVLAAAIAAEIASEPPRTQAEIDASNRAPEDRLDQLQREENRESCQNMLEEGLIYVCSAP
jgi:hypothetical protein